MARYPTKQAPDGEASLSEGEKEAFALPGSAPATGTAVVSVYCRWNPGLILRVGQMVKRTEQTAHGFRDFEQWQQTKQFRVYGPAHPWGGVAKAPVIGGYAITEGVPKELWDEWYDKNKDSDMVRNRIVFASEQQSYGNGQAHEQRSAPTGIEPLSQGKDWRTAALQTSMQSMTGIEKGEQAAA